MKKERSMAKNVIITLLLTMTLLCLAGCGGGGGGGSKGPTIPSAPDTPVLTPADKQITVTWLPVSGATGYEV